MKVRLDFGTELDILTQGELDESLSRAADTWYQRARGIRYVRRTSTPGAASVLVPGPQQGFAWDLKLIGAVFSAADSLEVFLGESQQYPLYGGTPGDAGTATTVDAATWSSQQVILKPGEVLTVAATAGKTITSLIVAAIELPAERLGVILS